MTTQTPKKTSAIIHKQKALDRIIQQLLAKSITRADIAVQGTPNQLKEKYGVEFIDPSKIQHSAHPPTQEIFLNDDFGWIVGFSFSIPLFVCLVLAIFVIGDIRSTSDNIIYGIVGAIVGSLLGLFVAIPVYMKHKRDIANQEKKGGFILWVTTQTPEQYQHVMKVFKKNRLRIQKP